MKIWTKSGADNDEHDKSFKTWWAKIEPALLKSALRIAPGESQDIVQDVGILALRNWDRFDQYEDFARWCQIRTRYLSLDSISRYKVRKSNEYIDPESLAAPEEYDIQFEFKHAIESLPSQQKKIVLYKFEGYSNEEIAELMNISSSTIRSHWRYAKKSLAEMIRG